MAKIHTHYDNLKVSRRAPQEVIRAAYKALSQKYHPDRNPGDDKAARIMAILNSAYDTLSDPVRRKEHDDWIAAEEWEVEWLESTRHEESPQAVQVPRRTRMLRILRRPAWWGAMGVALAAGIAGGVLLGQQPHLLPNMIAAIGSKADAHAAPPPARADAAPVADTRPDTVGDNWAAGKPYLAEAGVPAPEVRSLAVTQLAVPARRPECGLDLQTLSAPNGEPWPTQTGYVDGYPVANKGHEMQLHIDNSANGSPVFVKVYDLEHRTNVRHLFVQAHEQMQVDELAAGRYEVRYQNIQVGAAPGECPGRKLALGQAEADPQR